MRNLKVKDITQFVPAKDIELSKEFYSLLDNGDKLAIIADPEGHVVTLINKKRNYHDIQNSQLYFFLPGHGEDDGIL